MKKFKNEYRHILNKYANEKVIPIFVISVSVFKWFKSGFSSKRHRKETWRAVPAATAAVHHLRSERTTSQVWIHLYKAISISHLTASKGPITENCHLSFCDLDIHTPGMEWDYIAISHHLCNSHNMVMNFSHRWQILISVVQSSVSLNVSLCRNKILKILDNSHHTSGTTALLYDGSIFKW